MRWLGVALFDLLLLLFAIFTVHLFKYGTMVIGERHDGYVLLVLLSWLVFSAVFKKFSSLDRLSLTEGIYTIALTSFMMAGSISLFIVMLGLTSMSRMVVYGVIFLFAGLELASFGLYHAWLGRLKASGTVSTPAEKVWSGPSVSLVMADAVLLLFSLVLATFIKRGEFEFSNTNSDVAFLFVGVWLATSLLLRRFHKDHFDTNYGALAISIKSSLAMTMGLSFIIFGLRFYFFSRGQIFGAMLIFAIAETGLFYLYHRYRAYSREQHEGIYPECRRPPIYRQKRLPDADVLEADAGAAARTDSVEEKIRHALHFLEPELYDFIREAVDLSAINTSQSVLIHTDNLFNLDVLEDHRHELIINLHKINDMRFLNQYFLMAHDKLLPNGYLVGKAHTLTTHRRYFFRKIPEHGMGRFLYGLDFIWNRVCPKLPYIQKFYFAMTKGRSRLLSRAEILGRLYFCGFGAVIEKEISDRFFFIAKKIRTPSEDPSPTYGPLLGLTRFGMHNNPITVYKFRTMHPYSEYLQEYVYGTNQLKKGGKFKDDFRITDWGVWMRKFWIDELPMLYNWLRGDLKLVGVRPLSGQYLELYSPELRELRKQVKPGLLPPFYADMPKTLEEIMDSERRYIEAYLQNPLSTQVRYFFKCFYNIVIKRNRSA